MLRLSMAVIKLNEEGWELLSGSRSLLCICTEKEMEKGLFIEIISGSQGLNLAQHNDFDRGHGEAAHNRHQEVEDLENVENLLPGGLIST